LKIIITILLILSFVISCKQEEVPSWDDLTDAERQELRDRASTKCYSSSNSDLADIQDKTFDKMADYEPGYHWKIEVAGQTETDNLYLWKKSGTNFYFLYQTADKNQFIKITQGSNSDMLTYLRKMKCDKASDLLVVNLNASSFSIKELDEPGTCSGTRCKVDTTFTGSSSTPAFFGFYQYTKKQELLDDNGNVTSTKDLAYKISYIGEEPNNLEDIYTDYNSREYCIYTYALPVLPATTNSYTVPFALTCSTIGNPNTFGDTTLNFDPTLEL